MVYTYLPTTTENCVKLCRWEPCSVGCVVLCETAYMSKTLYSVCCVDDSSYECTTRLQPSDICFIVSMAAKDLNTALHGFCSCT